MFWYLFTLGLGVSVGGIAAIGLGLCKSADRGGGNHDQALRNLAFAWKHRTSDNEDKHVIEAMVRSLDRFRHASGAGGGLPPLSTSRATSH